MVTPHIFALQRPATGAAHLKPREESMKKGRSLIWMCCVLVMLSGPVLAADTDPADMPWKKGYLNLGDYMAFLFSKITHTLDPRNKPVL
jgi:hypothetical protein